MHQKMIAREKTNQFAVKLRRPQIAYRLIPRFRSRGIHRYRLTKAKLKQVFIIDQVAYYGKHFWYHINDQQPGWLPAKYFRKNYCQLQVNKLPLQKALNSAWQNFLTLYHYCHPELPLQPLIKGFKTINARLEHPLDLQGPIIRYLNTFHNISGKSFRRLRFQLWRQRPVILWVRGLHQNVAQTIILTGYNRRIFFYRDPLQHNCLAEISKKNLNQIWSKNHFWGVSC